MPDKPRSDVESQRTEWKASWRDDHLRWVCGFANAEGGVLVVGRNDKGKVVGVADAARLLEELPNKIRDLLGIIVQVNLRAEGGKDLLEIVTPAHSSPISYRGHYYQRSGSTLQELKGAALDRFLLGRHGRHWDDVPLPGVTPRSLSKVAVDAFRARARASQRVAAADLKGSPAELMEKLHLWDGTHLKRAAVLAFHAEPERFITGASVKIGFFQSNDDLRYHDEVRGPLFMQVDQTLEILRLKYLKAAISYEGIQRIETYPVPAPALREAVLNALIHKDYATGVPVQISVYDDKLMLRNPGQLPPSWTVAKLKQKHASHPFNPDLANVFFRAGGIEAWGRGIERIVAACEEAGTHRPRFRFDAGLWAEFPFSKAYLALIHGRPRPVGAASKAGATSEASPEVGGEAPVKTPAKSPVETRVKTPAKILELLAARPEMTLAEVADAIGKSVSAVERASAKLVKEGKLRFVGPRKGGHWEVLP